MVFFGSISVFERFIRAFSGATIKNDQSQKDAQQNLAKIASEKAS
jgi:hypothetical protein